MRRSDPSRALALLLAAALAAPAAALARPSPERSYRKHYERGERLLKRERYDEAIEAFTAAYALQQLPRLQYKIARAHLLLGHAREALAAYELFQQLEPDMPPEFRTIVDRDVAQARRMLAPLAPPPPVVPVPGAPAPPPAAATGVAAKGPQGAPAAAPPPAPSPPVLTVAPQAPAGPGPQLVPPTPARREKTPLYKRWWLWTAVGVAAASAATGLAVGLAVKPGAEPLPNHIDLSR